MQKDIFIDQETKANEPKMIFMRSKWNVNSDFLFY